MTIRDFMRWSGRFKIGKLKRSWPTHRLWWCCPSTPNPPSKRPNWILRSQKFWSGRSRCWRSRRSWSRSTRPANNQPRRPLPCRNSPRPTRAPSISGTSCRNNTPAPTTSIPESMWRGCPTSSSSSFSIRSISAAISSMWTFYPKVPPCPWRICKRVASRGSRRRGARGFPSIRGSSPAICTPSSK